MKFDFSQPITTYEFIAIILSTIALLIPILKFLYNKFICKARIELILFDNLKLFFNKSGPYCRVGIAINCLKQDSTISRFNMKIIREEDNATLKLGNCTFLPTITQSVSGNYLVSQETSHPFNVKKDGIIPIVMEFSLSNNEVVNELKMVFTDNINYVNRELKDSTEYEQIKKRLLANDKYIEGSKRLLEEFFWKKGNYKMVIYCNYNNSYCEKKVFNFNITTQESEKLKNNIQEAFLSDLNQNFFIPNNFYVLQKDIED